MPPPTTTTQGSDHGHHQILDQSGDTAVIWDLDDEATLRAAEEIFEREAAQAKMAFARPLGAPVEQAERIEELRPHGRGDHLGPAHPGWVIPSLRLVEDIPDWGALVEVVGGEHHGARTLLVPADRVLPHATTGPRRLVPPVRRPLRLVEDRMVGSAAWWRVEADRRAESLLESLLDDGQRARVAGTAALLGADPLRPRRAGPGE